MKRSITLSGHRTSVSLEKPFWDALLALAEEQDTTPTNLIAAIDNQRLPEDNLSSAIRVHILKTYQQRALEKTNA